MQILSFSTGILKRQRNSILIYQKYKWSQLLFHMLQLHITEVGKKLQICLWYGDAEFPMLCIVRTSFEQNNKVILHIQALIKYLVHVHN